MPTMSIDSLPKIHEEEIGGVKLTIRGTVNSGYFACAERKFFFTTEDDEEPEFIRVSTNVTEYRTEAEALALGQLKALRLGRHIQFIPED